MAYIVCDKHGGQLASLVSQRLHKLVEGAEGKSAIGIETIKYESCDGQQFSMFLDSDTFDKLSLTHNIDLSKTITDEEQLFELTLDFVAICPICLKEWLAK